MDSHEQISLSNKQHENARINSSKNNSSINNIPAISGNCDVNSVFRHLCLNHPQQIIIGHLNINSIRNKFDLMKIMLTRDIDILMITGTKLDDSFPVSQFEIDSFSAPLDRNKNGDGILLYIRSYIVASKLNNYIFANGIEAFFIEINIKSNKWLIGCSYNPNTIFVSGHSDHIAKRIDAYSKKYGIILLMDDFNIELKEANMTTFYNQY